MAVNAPCVIFSVSGEETKTSRLPETLAFGLTMSSMATSTSSAGSSSSASNSTASSRAPKKNPRMDIFNSLMERHRQTELEKIAQEAEAEKVNANVKFASANNQVNIQTSTNQAHIAASPYLQETNMVAYSTPMSGANAMQMQMPMQYAFMPAPQGQGYSLPAMQQGYSMPAMQQGYSMPAMQQGYSMPAMHQASHYAHLQPQLIMAQQPRVTATRNLVEYNNRVDQIENQARIARLTQEVGECKYVQTRKAIMVNEAEKKMKVDQNFELTKQILSLTDNNKNKKNGKDNDVMKYLIMTNPQLLPLALCA